MMKLFSCNLFPADFVLDRGLTARVFAQWSPVFCVNELCFLAGGESMTKPSRIKGQVVFGQRDLYMLNIAKCLNFVLVT